MQMISIIRKSIARSIVNYDANDRFRGNTVMVGLL